MAEREPHRGDLLLLIDYDLLRDPPQSFVVSVAKFRHRHFDGALMMWDHHLDEVTVHIASCMGHHSDIHCRHGLAGIGKEGASLVV